jgi:hypothetical protein
MIPRKHENWLPPKIGRFCFQTDVLLHRAPLLLHRIVSQQDVFEKLFFSRSKVGFCVMVQVFRCSEESLVVAQQILDSSLFLIVSRHANLL